MTIQRATGRATRLRREPAPLAGMSVYFEHGRGLAGPFEVLAISDSDSGTTATLAGRYLRFKQSTSTLWVLDEGEVPR